MEVLKVYYLSLLFGFQGQYRVRGGEIELASITEEVGSRLTQAGMIGDAALSPHAARPQENLGGVRSHMPLVYISVVALLLAIGVVGGLVWSVSSQADDLIEHIQSVNGVSSDSADSDD